jgi:hypothetical protein
MTSLDSDPIFAAISRHNETARALDATLAERQRLYTPGNFPELDPGLADAEQEAAAVVVNTVPTTRAGLKALEAHLAKERSSLCWAQIRNQLVDEGQTFEPSSSSLEYFGIPVARFIAARTAELG